MTAAIAWDYLNKYAPFVADQLHFDNATTTQNFLYGDIDLSTLGWFERAWADYYIFIGNAVIATGLMSFLMHEIVYFGRCIPWLVIDAMPYFRKWKIQQGKTVTTAELKKCLKLVLLTHFTVELPQIFLFHPMCCAFGMKTFEVPFSPPLLAAAQIAFFFVFEDTWHYFAHRALHWGPLYKNIHKLHHQFSAPVGLAAEYAHPLEILILGQGTVGGPFLYCLFRQDLHILTVYIWITLRLWQAVDAHSGYDFPGVSLRYWIPFWAGADHHDYHHQSFTSCFSTSFRWWDTLFSTDVKYHAHKARIAAASQKDRAAVEKAENERIEQEGIIAERIAAGGGGAGVVGGVKKEFKAE